MLMERLPSLLVTLNSTISSVKTLLSESRLPGNSHHFNAVVWLTHWVQVYEWWVWKPTMILHLNLWGTKDGNSHLFSFSLPWKSSWTVHYISMEIWNIYGLQLFGIQASADTGILTTAWREYGCYTEFLGQDGLSRPRAFMSCCHTSLKRELWVSLGSTAWLLESDITYTDSPTYQCQPVVCNSAHRWLRSSEMQMFHSSMSWLSLPEASLAEFLPHSNRPPFCIGIQLS